MLDSTIICAECHNYQRCKEVYPRSQLIVKFYWEEDELSFHYGPLLN